MYRSKLVNSLCIIFRELTPNIVKKLITLRRQPRKSILSNAKQKFINLNHQSWKNHKKKSESVGFVLVEGFMASYGPNYLLRLGIAAKALEAELNLTPLVLFEKYIESEDEKIKLFQSFDINKFETTLNFNPSLFEKLKNIILSLKFYWSIIKPEDLLTLEYKGIVFGDLLYDTILKNRGGVITLSKVSIRELYYIYESLCLFSIYNRLLDRNAIKFYITTHSQFTTFGILLRLCLSKNIPAIETTDIMLRLYQKKTNEKRISYPKYHDDLQVQIKDLLDKKHDLSDTLELDKVLKDRFAGTFDQSDVRLAYKNKKVYNRIELCDTLDIKNDFPFVFIFAHIFSDSPQSASSGMLFRDYYTWLEKTIQEACTIPNVNWIVKPHPSSAFYNETGMVDGIVAKHYGSCVFLCPDDLSPASVIDIASAIITAQGTVGIEYSCMGIPVILAGKPFYSGFGFTIEPTSILEYKSTLKEIVKYPKLSKEQKSIAKRVFETFIMMQQTDTSLIDTDVLLAIWGGDGTTVSSDKAFDLINQKLPGFDLKQYSLYIETVKLVKNLHE